MDKLSQRPLYNILFSRPHIPHISHNSGCTLAEFCNVQKLVGAGARRRRLLPAREPGALSALNEQRGEQILGISRAHAEFFHLLDVFRGYDAAMWHNDLELDKVCDIKNWWLALCNAGTYQRPVEIGQALSFLPIVGNFCANRGAQVSCYRDVLIVEGDGEVILADTRHVLQDQVVVRGASAYYTNRSTSTMTEPRHEAVSILEESVLRWGLRFTSFLPRNVVLL